MGELWDEGKERSEPGRGWERETALSPSPDSHSAFRLNYEYLREYEIE